MKYGNDNKNTRLKSIVSIIALIAIAVIIVSVRLGDNKSSVDTEPEYTVSNENSTVIKEEVVETEIVEEENDVSIPETEDEGAIETSPEPEEIEETTNSDSVSDVEAVVEENAEPEFGINATRFRNKKLLNQHYEKHGIDMGFSSAEEYESAAAQVVLNPVALHKIEAEDGDYIYYVEATNDFVVVSTDGYIRTYFRPDKGKRYFDKQ